MGGSRETKAQVGIDGMHVDELLPFLREHKKELVQSLRDGKYLGLDNI